MLIRIYAVLLVAAGLLACGGGGGTPAPTPTPNPAPSTPTELWSVAGRITTYGTGSAVSGAKVTPEGGTAVQADSNGNYKIAGTTMPASQPLGVTVEADGYVTRQFYVRYQTGTRAGLDIDLIKNASPFSLDFYRQLVRDAYDNTRGSLEVVWRLPETPKFYVRTIDQNGRAVESEVLANVLPAIRQAVSDWSNGTMSVSTLETGTETRQREEGWIIVNITRNYSAPYCGQAYVGSTRGEIELVDDRCHCGSNKISGAIVAHEVGHAMGFFHVNDRKSLMYPYVPGNCPPGQLSANERYHSALAYARTRGNADPDADDSSAQMIGGGERPDLRIEN